MKKLLLGSIIMTSSVLTSVGIQNNYTPRIAPSKESGLVEYKIQDLAWKENILDEKVKEKRISEERERLKRLEYIEKQNRIKKEQEDLGRKVEFTLSFYTSLPSENGGHTTTCRGEKLQYGMVASNVYKLGTKIYLKGYGHFTVSDRGGSDFNVDNRLDVLIEREQGESNNQYLNRVNNMGKPTVIGYVKNK